MKNVQDIYSLSPMQQGLLFHALSDSANGAYVERVSWLLSGNVDVDAYRAAWEHTINSHPILSTSFHFEGLDEPVQVVRRSVKLPWQQDDWRHLSAAEQEQRFNELLKEERRQGFKLNSAPLMRLNLLQLQPNLYRFLWSYHHLLLDGWSISLVLRHVLEAYERLRRSQPPPQPVAIRPYRDYIGWLQRQDLRAAETFWREKLRGFSVPTKLGVERSTSATTTPGERYRKLHRVLSVETTKALQSLARQHQLTLSPMIHAAWSLLLSRYSGDREVLFGSVVSGRPTALEGAETMVGLFINTLPVRVKVSGEERVLDWLKQLQSQQVELQQYEYSPLRQVQRWSEVRNGQPLFDSVVVVRNLPIDESLRQEGADAEVRELCHHEMATGHPLTLGVLLEPGLRVQLTYDSEKYDEETIQRMLGHVEHLLEEIVADPEQRVSEVSLLTAAEEHYLREEVNDTAREFATELLTHELFEQQVARTPAAVALRARVVGEAAVRELSYRELNEAANRVAHLLRERGVGVGELVAVCLERTAESVMALLGIWKAGAAYLPLDVEQPAPRIQLMLEEAAPVLVLTTAALRERLGVERALCLDEEAVALERQPVSNPCKAVAAKSLAYVIYTSGSTGRPKGVMVEHGQLQNTLLAAQEFYQFSAAEVMACVAPFAFDISLFELLSPLLVGGRVVLVGGRELLEQEAAGAVLSEVTFLHSAPGLMRQLAGYLKAHGDRDYSQIRGVMVGGDVVSPELLEQLREALPQAQLYVGYGPTEAAIMCAAYEVPKQGGVEQRMLGYPLANTKLRLYEATQAAAGSQLPGAGGRDARQISEVAQGGKQFAQDGGATDAGATAASEDQQEAHGRKQLVPVGVVGEVYIGGVSVSRGYLQSEELTSEKFVELEGERWYRSGDLGRRLADGSIAFVGRADGQVKVRGYRIEVGEVEAVLESAEGVRAAAVALKQDVRGEGRLVGYVVLEEGTEFNQGELRRQVAERLPEYMVPVVLVELKELPLTPLAKVDRKALPEIEQVQREREYEPPRTAVEEVLCDIWSEVLQVDRVGINESFFELGGHSLLATQLMSRVRETLQVEVALRELFEEPTVAGFAERVEAALRAGAGVSAPPIRRVERREEMVLSFAQQRLWFIEQLRPGSAIYNMLNPVRLSGPLNVAALEATLTEIVKRHEMLRTTFREVAGQAVQVIQPAAPVPLQLIDLSHLVEAERETELEEMVQREGQQPFDLNTGPLLRATLIKLDREEHVVLLTMHHIVSDGWSMGVLTREVAALYRAYVNRETARLPELPVQYADFATWQREWLQGEVLAQQVAYWREQLAGAPAVLELPVDHPRPAVQSHRGARQSFTLPDELKQRLEELSRREGVTLFMTLLGAWQTLLMRYSGQQDIVVGTTIANRNRRETENLIGFFVNTLVLRTDVSGNPSFRELLKRVREVALGEIGRASW